MAQVRDLERQDLYFYGPYLIKRTKVGKRFTCL